MIGEKIAPESEYDAHGVFGRTRRLAFAHSGAALDLGFLLRSVLSDWLKFAQKLTVRRVFGLAVCVP